MTEMTRRESAQAEKFPTPLPEGLHLLPLPQSRPGFQDFISSWFFVDSSGRKMLVDPGPASTIPLLLRQLSRITDGVDLVLLTHIHLDHSGGLAQFCKTCDAKVLVHPRGRKHLLDPEKFWTASLGALGEIAEMYGRPLPLPPESLLDGVEGVTVLETPGHAPHHLSFIVPFRGERLFFVGEAAGLYMSGASAPNFPYLRPTTPPRFDCGAAQASLDRIEQNLQGNELLCYSHYGAARQPRRMIALEKEQIGTWLSLISRMRGSSEEDIADRLLSQDPLLRGLKRLPEDLRERERVFILNSVKGFLGYFEKRNERH
jgi:glyoxylase-like metal-dependent hydrolase (beta-lactamase superfamily II)